MFKNFIRLFFYGNIYLGIFAVALCIESNLLNNLFLNTLPFYLLIFLATCIYYTTIYVRSIGAKNYDERTVWYRNNIKTIKTLVNIAFALMVFSGFYLFKINIARFQLLSLGQFILLLLFPLIAAWYTFSPKLFRLKKIRQTGWLKPFIVGSIWSGWVTIYPVIFSNLRANNAAEHIFFPSLLLLFLHNFFFCTIIAIIFDIKDYRSDTAYRLKTFPVVFGIKNTFRFVIIPLVVLNLLVFTLFQIQQQFTLLQSFIQLLPLGLLMLIIATHTRKKKVLYYLVVVDGLVFVKALCGITSILFIKK